MTIPEASGAGGDSKAFFHTGAHAPGVCHHCCRRIPRDHARKRAEGTTVLTVCDNPMPLALRYAKGDRVPRYCPLSAAIGRFNARNQLLHNTPIALRFTTVTPDVHLPHLCVNHQVGGTFFSPWNRCSSVLRTPGILTLAYGTAKRKILPGVAHRQGWHLNHRCENAHRPTRQRVSHARVHVRRTGPTIIVGVWTYRPTLTLSTAPLVGVSRRDAKPLRTLGRNHGYRASRLASIEDRRGAAARLMRVSTSTT
jgi:hypothetical protein